MQETITPEQEAVVRCQAFLSDYTLRVRDWEVRPHQVAAFSALQAVADGVLRHPSGGLGPNGMGTVPPANCKKCIAIETAWIEQWNLPYEVGWQAVCGECLTTNKLLWLAFYAAGKSDTLIEWIEWIIGKATLDGTIPQCGWISYIDDVADLRSVAVRDTIEFNERYHIVFPGARPAKKKGWGEGEWFITRSDPGQKDPTFRASGIFGGILAYRFNTAEVIDDPQDPNEAKKSQTYRDDTWAVWDVIESRGAKGRTPIVTIANRWAEDDIPGRMLELEGDWAFIITPALNEQDESVFPPEEWNGKHIGISTADLHDLRRKNRPKFMTGWMCQPPSEEGDMFQHFMEGDAPLPHQVARCIQFWDTTTTEKTSSDYVALAELHKLNNGRTFVRKMLNFKKSPSAVIDVMLAEYWRAEEEGLTPLIVIEQAHAGPVFVSWLRQYAGVRVRSHSWGGHGVKNTHKLRGPKDLYARAYGIVGHLDGGIIYFPKGWVVWDSGDIRTSKDEVYTQMKAFGPDSRGHDDIVAAIVGGGEFLYPARRSGRPKPSWIPVRA